MFPKIEVTNAFKWAWFKIILDWCAYYINLSDARKFTWEKEVTKSAIKDKIISSLWGFITFFHTTQSKK